MATAARKRTVKRAVRLVRPLGSEKNAGVRTHRGDGT
jgi:hypothetical protein